MSDQAPKKDVGKAGAPVWVITFADLMSLLMCFFALLLSFSEMDVQKFKQLSGSMDRAFGVQREVRAHEIPKGTSVVSKEFSPGIPEKTLLRQVRQTTADRERKKLAKQAADVEAQQQTEADARLLAKLLSHEIKRGQIEIETGEQKIILRILEKGSFGSGDAALDKNILPVMKTIRVAMKTIHGKIKVSGHTDDLPIHNSEYPSNWALSAKRAVSVVHALQVDGILKQQRFEVAGYADTKPRVPNNNSENRAKNRRVEITIVQNDKDVEKDSEFRKVQRALKLKRMSIKPKLIPKGENEL